MNVLLAIALMLWTLGLFCVHDEDSPTTFGLCCLVVAIALTAIALVCVLGRAATV